MQQKPSQLDDFAESYTDDFEFYEENLLYLGQYASLLEASLRKHKPASLLSLGLGHGVVLKRLLGLCRSESISYTVVDGSQKVIDLYKPVISDQVNLVHSYFENFEPPAPVDAIEMGFILEHVDDPLALLKKYRNHLSEQGRIYVAVPNARSLHRLIGFEAGLLPDMYELSSADHQLGHQRYYDLESLQQQLRDAGFIPSTPIGLMLKPITQQQMRQLGFSGEIYQALLKVGLELPAIANCLYIEAAPAQ